MSISDYSILIGVQYKHLKYCSRVEWSVRRARQGGLQSRHQIVRALALRVYLHRANLNKGLARARYYDEIANHARFARFTLLQYF